MADSDDKDPKQTSEGNQETGRQSVILGLAEQLLAEADRLARGVKEDAEREAETQAATIVGEAEAQAATVVSEAERRAEDIVSAAGEKAKRLESQAHAAVRKLSEKVRGELESSVSALDKLAEADGETEIGATERPQGHRPHLGGGAPSGPQGPKTSGVRRSQPGFRPLQCKRPLASGALRALFGHPSTLVSRWPLSCWREKDFLLRRRQRGPNLRMVPSSPTAQPLLLSAKATPLSPASVPLGHGVQVIPPSLELTIMPNAPTAHPLSASTKTTSRKVCPVSESCLVQVAPPSVVRATIPSVKKRKNWRPDPKPCRFPRHPDIHPLFSSRKNAPVVPS